MESQPKIVFLLCGKRKSGKDYVADKLCELIGHENVSIIRISGPLKEQYAKDHNLDYSRLLDSSSYKEEHRLHMIEWGEEVRGQDPGYFCSLATKSATKSVWIVSDCRRPTDMNYFTSNYNCVSVRVYASEETRRARGWIYTLGIDDVPSECGLDSYSCDCHVTNDGDQSTLAHDLDNIVKKLQSE